MSLLENLLIKNPSLTLNSQYTNIRKYANGSFSDVFFAENLTKTTNVVLKAPHKTQKSYAEISREAILLIKLKDSGFVPKVLYLQADAVCEVMVLEKLGVSLEVLKQEYNNFSLKTTILLACQLLNILEKMHELGILHRDIKPSNILIGEGLNKNKVYLIDFDIAQTFTQTSKDSKEIVFGNQFVGTKAFASRNAHKCGTFGRKDDIESLFFTIIYLLEGKLPWTSMKCDLRAMGAIKDQFLKSRMLEELPKEFAQFFEYLEKMKCETIPDYVFLKNLFVSMAKRFSLNLEDNECEWTENETSFEEMANEICKEKSKEIFQNCKNCCETCENCQNCKEDDEIVTESDESSLDKKIFELKSLTGEKKKGFMMKNNKKSSFMTGFKEIFLKQQIQ